MRIKNSIYTIISALTMAAMLAGLAGLSGCNMHGNASYEDAERALIQKGTGLLPLRGNDGHKGNATITVTPEHHLLELLKVDSLNTTTFEIHSKVSGEDTYSALTYKNGETEVLTVDTWFDGNSLILHLPKILDKYLSLDLDGLNLDLPQSLSKLPSKEEADELSAKLLDEYFSLISDTVIEEDVELSVEGSLVRFKKATIRITDEMLAKLGLLMLTELEQSESAQKLQKALEAIDTPKEVATMEVYIKGAGIVKRVVEINEIHGYRVGLDFDFSDDGFAGEVLLSGVKVATVEVQLSKDYEGEEAPQLDSDNSIDMSDEGERFSLIAALTMGYMDIASSYENDGYDIIGYLLSQYSANLLENFATFE